MFPTLEDHQTWLLRLVEIYDSKHPDHNYFFDHPVSNESSGNQDKSYCLDAIKPYESFFFFEAEAKECMQYFIKNQVLHYPLTLTEPLLYE